MNVVFRRELKALFSTPAGFVFLAVYQCASGLWFTLSCTAAGSGDIKAYFSAFAPVMMFLLPLLTMRLYAEERNMKTEEILLSAPIRLTSIVAGKYAAAMVVFFAAFAPTLFFPVILAALGAGGEALPAVGCIIGTVLTASAYVSAGLLISIKTESQTAAAAATYALFLLMYVMSPQGGMAPGGFAGDVAAFFSFTTRFAGFASGIFNPADIFYFISATVLFLFLGTATLEDRRIA